ncbi:GNAT family N-acetyltransferase [Pokkaliibacter sp. CJK22405]|uniref:GNAT family N-acetyltransferase n=1 Tax=Pokkaliibacter sp. CJK22405 TaxID=3384615 RepID=UPI0039852733
MLRLEVDEEISLCLCSPDMAEPIFSIVDAQRPWLERWLAWPPEIKSPDDALNMIRQQLHLLAERELMPLCIIYRGQLAGGIHLQQIDWRIETGRVGYWLSEDCTGKGIMRRALEKMMRLAFEEWQLVRLEIRVASDNAASRRVIERAGFLHEGRIRHAEKLGNIIVDHDIYGLMKEEWRAR